ncbi:MAG TPA: ACP S-malonyltransferase [Candidatus Dormibacteraeota bacterium]|nr:ACP S-malonyltransferase [Candidatus Dormibacteraeota bacterium]
MTVGSLALPISLGRPVGLLFPGQGVQHAGMGRPLAAISQVADRIISRAQDVLEMPVRRLCFDGPDQELRRTENLQPCLMAVCWAAFEAYRDRFGLEGVEVVAGHSMGEITACAAAEAISWEAALLLVRERGRLMADAALSTPGRMLAIVGLLEPEVEQIRLQASAAGGLWLANFNAPDQFILSGEAGAVAVAEGLATQAGARRVLLLEVPLAAHSPLMGRAAGKLSEAVKALPLRAPRIPLIGNGTGLAISTVRSLRSELSGHLLRPVHWARTMTSMQGLKVKTVVELGPGRVLASLAAKHMPGVATWNADELLVEGAN